MNTKDWMILFIPIACNGLIIWFFQLHIKRFYERRDKVLDNRKNIVKELNYNLINLQKALYYLGKNSDNEDHDGTKAFNEVTTEIQTLKLFYDANQTVLMNFSDDLQKCFLFWNQASDLIRIAVLGNDGRLDKQSWIKFNNLHKNLYEITLTLLHKCCNFVNLDN